MTEGEPEHVKPTKEVQTRPTPKPIEPRPTEPEIKPGDLICRNCGAGNKPGNNFCRRCGKSLATAVVAVKPPWYRRLFSRDRRAVAAGERPRGMGRDGQPGPSWLKRFVVAGLIAIVVLPIVGYFLVPSVRDRIDDLIATANRAVILYQHPWQNAIDEDVDSYWLAEAGETQPIQWFSIDETTGPWSVDFNLGAPGDYYLNYARPQKVELWLEGASSPQIIDLGDLPQPRPECVPVSRSITQFGLRILETHPAAPGGEPLAAIRKITLTAGDCP